MARQRKYQSHLCSRCLVKWRQDSRGLCRQCAKDTGVVLLTTRQADAALIQRQQGTPTMAQPRIARLGTVVYEGVEFERVWDGVGPLPGYSFAMQRVNDWN